MAGSNTLDKEGYLLTDMSGLRYHFTGPENRLGYKTLSGISTKDGFKIRFNYASGGKLSGIITSRGETLKVATDDLGRVLRVSTRQDGEVVNLVRYRYDDCGDMVETTDSLDVSKPLSTPPDTCWCSSPTRAACPSIGTTTGGAVSPKPPT